MRRLLLVANQTVGGQHLQKKVAQCMAEGPCQFYLIVPATRDPNHSFLWTEGQGIALARQRLEDAMKRLREMGANVEGDVGDQSPLTAIVDALRVRQFDEIVLSTLPPGISRWLAQDLPSRVRRVSALPVTHIVSVERQAPAPKPAPASLVQPTAVDGLTEIEGVI
jgi:hypothetical protein